MNGRDRSSGWKHAKLSGHKNEVMVAQLLDTNFSYRKEFLKRVNASEKASAVSPSAAFTKLMCRVCWADPPSLKRI